jgi:hypothetical protein
MTDRVVVYTMEKVGSSTVLNTVQSCGTILADRAYLENESTINFDVPVITMVRDPIARNLSRLWWYVERYPQGLHGGYLNHFTNYFNHDTPFTWFSNIQRKFGIDVYEGKFNRRLGFRIYGDKLLLIRTEDLDRQLIVALSLFLDVDPDKFTLKTGGLGKDKFGPDYVEFLKTAKFDEEFLDRMYNTPYCDYFYYKKELAEFRKKWGKKQPTRRKKK